MGSSDGSSHFISVATNGDAGHHCFKFAPAADLQEDLDGSMDFRLGGSHGFLQQKLHPSCDLGADDIYETLNLVGMSATEHTPKAGDNANVPMVALSFHYTCQKMGVGQAGVILVEGRAADRCSGLTLTTAHDFRTTPDPKTLITLSGSPTPFRVSVVRLVDNTAGTDITLHFVLYKGEGLVVYRDNHKTATFEVIGAEKSAMAQSAVDFTTLRIPGTKIVCYFQGPSGFSRRYYEEATGFATEGSLDEASLASGTLAVRDENPSTSAQHAYWPEFDASGKWAQIRWIKAIADAGDLAALGPSAVSLGLLDKKPLVAPSKAGVWAATSTQLLYLPHCDPADLSYEVYTDQGKFRYSYAIATDNVDSPVEVTAVVPSPLHAHVTVGLKVPAKGQAHLVVVAVEDIDCAATCEAWGMLQGSSPCDEALRPASCTASACALSTRLCCGKHCGSPIELQCAEGLGARVRPGATSSTFCGRDTCDRATYCCSDTCASQECIGSTILKNNPVAIFCGPGCSASDCCDPSTVTSCLAYVCPFGYTASGPKECGGDGGVCRTTDCCKKTCEGGLCPPGYVLKSPGTYPNDCCTPTCTFHQCSEGFASKAASTVCPSTLQLCGDDVCCDALLCGGFTCPSDYVRKEGSESHSCTGPCTQDECCATSCGLYSCGAGATAKTEPVAANTIPCTGAECTDLLCCDATCALLSSCPAKDVKKLNAGSITCGPTSADCDATKCCDATCDYNLCGDPGFTKKVVPVGRIVCAFRLVEEVSEGRAGLALSDPTLCTDAVCCDVLCSHAGVTCPANRPKKTATVTCGPTVDGCTQDECCEAFCGANNDCSETGYTKKDNHATIKCIDTSDSDLSDPADCTKTVCCDVLCSHAGVTCPANRPKKTATVMCGPTVDGCTPDECCEAFCGANNDCSKTGFVKKDNHATIKCIDTSDPNLSDPADCTEAVCCDVLCSFPGVVCPSNRPKKTATVMCGPTVDGCTQDECCEAFCGANNDCSKTGFVKKDNHATIKCIDTSDPNLSDPADCTEAVCCDATCALLSSCPAKDVKKLNAGSITCGPTSADCNAERCCDATCDYNLCGDPGFTKKVVPVGRIVCAVGAVMTGGGGIGEQTGGLETTTGSFASRAGLALSDSTLCTNAVCCNVLCSHAGVTCPANRPKKTATVMCGPTVDGCTLDECCEAFCGANNDCSETGYTKKDNHATIKCIDTSDSDLSDPADCTKTVCCDVLCSFPGVECTPNRPKKTATVMCGPTVDGCTQDECCEAFCGANNDCSKTGFVKKDNHATIKCIDTSDPNLSDPADCTEAVCCDVLCSHAGVTCPANRPKKTATVMCGPTVDGCTPDECCEAFCGANNDCSKTGFVKKDNHATIKCIDTSDPNLSDPADCTEAVCCDVLCSHADVSCPAHDRKKTTVPILCGGTAAACARDTCCDAFCGHNTCSDPGFQQKADFLSIKCSSPGRGDAVEQSIPSLCTNALCCDALVYCGTFNCGLGFTDKAAKATLVCGVLAGDCDAATCCDVLCSHGDFSCPSNTQKKTTEIRCGPTATDCTETKCCEAFCGANNDCSKTGFVKKDNHATIKCIDTSDPNLSDPADCTEAVCCDATCALLSSCPAKDVKKLNAGSITCGPTSADCNAERCCDATCDYNLCGDPGFTKKVVPVGRIVCAVGAVKPGSGGIGEETGLENTVNSRAGLALSDPTLCTNAVCCNVLCSHAGVTCPANRPKKTATVMCGPTVDGCTQDECCEAFCGVNNDCSETGYTKKDNHATIKCIDTSDSDLSDPADCTKTVCCDVLCSFPGVECTPNRPKKTATVMCGPTVDECTQDECCEAFCGANNDCSKTGFVKKDNHATIKCIDTSNPNLSDPADCTEAVCCDVLCSHAGVVCPANRPKKTATVMCGPTVDGCTQDECCEAFCGANNDCSKTGFVKKDNHATIKCIDTSDPNLSDPADCTEAVCCDATCALLSSCPDKDVKKLNAGSITCGPTSADCNAERCCDATCDYNLCGDPGFTKKVVPVGRIVCAVGAVKPGSGGIGEETGLEITINSRAGLALSDPTLCTNAVCCNVLCSHAGVTCPANRPKKTATVMCGPTVDGCTQDECCEAFCGANNDCSETGYTKKDNHATIKCIDTSDSDLSDPADCTKTVCCDVLCSFPGVECTPNRPKKTATVMCGPTVDECTQDECCEAFCGANNDCSKTGFVKKDNHATIKCIDTSDPNLSDPADCTEAVCCDVLCSHAGVVCPANRPKKTATVMCGPTVDGCTQDECCEAFCGANNDCSKTGFVKKDNHATIKCIDTSDPNLSDPADCTEAVCCDATCALLSSCPAKDVKKLNAGSITCGPTSADCNAERCCDATCDYNLCGDPGFTKKVVPVGHIVCAFRLVEEVSEGRAGLALSDPTLCTDAVCCDVLCSHAGVTCPANRPKKTATVMCGPTVDGCTLDECCEAFCGANNDCSETGYTKKDNHATIKCIDTSDSDLSDPADCTKTVCCDVLCSFPGVECTPNRPKKTATVMCGPTVDGCTQDECCEAFCGANNDCSKTGFVKKDNHATIKCIDMSDPNLSDPADCTEAVCCDVLCSHAGVTCPANRPKKTATVTCGPTVDGCTQDECCEAFCGVNNDCSKTGFVKKDNHATIKCIDTSDPNLSDPADCTEAVCCDVLCSHAGVVCPANRPKKTATVTCGPTVDGCTPDECCEAFCGANNDCSKTGFVKKDNHATLKCIDTSDPNLSDPADCTEAVCCDVLCSFPGVECPAKRPKKTATVTCGPTVDGCTQDECCEAFCGANNDCSKTGFVKKDSHATIKCIDTSDPNLSDPADCTEAVCCDVLCSHAGVTCPANRPKKTATVTCGPTVDECTQDECCEAFCGANNDCSITGFVKKDNHATIKCIDTSNPNLSDPADCTEAGCCDVLCSHAGVTCPANRPKKTATVMCGPTVDGCTQDECCEAFCGANNDCSKTGYTKKDNHATIKCIDTSDSDLSDPADCTEAVCCDVLCSHPGFQCPVSFVPKVGVNRCGPSVSQCSKALCCDALVYCASHSCGLGYLRRPASAGVVCGTDLLSCSDVLCCDATCLTHTVCPVHHLPKVDPVQHNCGGNPCTDAFCCDLTCSSFTCVAPFQPKAAGVRCLEACDYDTCCDISCHLQPDKRWFRFAGRCRCLGCGPDGPKLCGKKGVERDSAFCQKYATDVTGEFRVSTAARPLKEALNTACARALVEAEPLAGGIWVDVLGVPYPMAWNVGPPPQCGAGRLTTKDTCKGPHCEWDVKTASCVHSGTFYRDDGCPTCRCYIPESTDGHCTPQSGAFVVGRHCMCDELQGFTCGASGQCMRR